MITGDDIKTTAYAAMKAGLITEEEMKKPNVVMTGETFRNKISHCKIN